MKDQIKKICAFGLGPRASRLRPHQLLLLLVTLFAAFMATPCFAAGTRDEVLLEGSSIHVGDIFLEPGDQAATVIAAAPEPGKSIIYDVSDLARIAKTTGINWKPSSNYERVTVTRASEAITAAMVKDLAAEQLRTEDMNADLNVTLDNRGLEIHRPKGKALSYRLTDFQHDIAGRRFNASLVVDAANGAKADIVRVSGRAMPMVQVAQLRHGVSTGDGIRADDVEWLRLPQDKAGGDAVSLAQQLNGMEAIRNLGAGAILRLRDVRPARIVTKGTLIAMVVETSLLQITAQGRALESAAMGETLRVTNTQSNRTVDAIVVGSNKVSVIPPGRNARVAAEVNRDSGLGTRDLGLRVPSPESRVPN